ncbi:MAG TPA: calcium-binding protein [Caulobacteraceae bacterium]|jgi:Ca2+-binding RTX toxin-like protein
MSSFPGTIGNDSIKGTNSGDTINDGGGGFDTLDGAGGADKITVTGGLDSVIGGAGDDLLIVDYSADTGSFRMNGASFTDTFDTSVVFSEIERFDVTFGSGADIIVLGDGKDIASMGAGDDSINTLKGAATVDGGAGGNDLWLADFSDTSAAIKLNLNLVSSSLGNGSQVTNVERVNITGSTAGDTLITRTGAPNDGFSDVVRGLDGDDRIVVGGGLDTVDGGADTDTLVIDYATDTGSFGMSGSIISDFSSTSVSFTDIERFDVAFGSGSDTIVLGDGADTASMGTGDDSIDTKKGQAIVNGGAGGNDRWLADYSDTSAGLVLDLNKSLSTFADGSEIRGIERVNLTGSTGADLIITRTGNPDDGFVDVVRGFDGDDRIVVGGGLDQVDGGLGDHDTLVIDYGSDAGSFKMSGSIISDFSNTSVSFTGIEHFDATFGSGADTVVLGDGADTASMGTGDDSIDTKKGKANVNGGGGNGDRWLADYSDTSANVVLNLNKALSTFVDGSQIRGIECVNLTGSASGDLIITRTGAPDDGLSDTVRGFDGDDVIFVGGGIDSVDGGNGNDFLAIDYTNDTGSFRVSGANISDFFNTSVAFTGIERFAVNLGSGNDNIFTGAGDDALRGRAGNDTLSGLDGADTIEGGAGDDVLDGGGGDSDVLDYAFAAGGVTVSLNIVGNQNTGGAGSDNIIGFENLTGSDHGDTLAGNLDDNILVGGKGGDNIAGLDGNDVVEGGAGADTLNGNAGEDAVSYRGAEAGVKVSLKLTGAQNTGGAGTDRIAGCENVFGSDFDDTLTGAGDDNFLLGAKGDDVLEGLAGDDVLQGDSGDDRLVGGGDTDVLFGGNGEDQLFGDSGVDILRGGGGHDVLEGGASTDSFQFTALTDSAPDAQDLITDLTDQDLIQFIGIDADATQAGEQTFEFVSSVGDGAGEATLIYSADQNRTVLRLYVDGDNTADMIIAMVGDQTGFDGFVI